MAQPRFRSDFEVTPTTVAGKPRFELWDPVTEREIRLGLLEYQIVSLFDGQRTVDDVTREMEQHHGVVRAHEKVSRLADKMLRYGVLVVGDQTMPEQSPFTGTALRGPLRFLVIKLVEIKDDRWIDRVLSHCPWLISRRMFEACAGMSLLMVLIPLLHWGRFVDGMGRIDLSEWTTWLQLLVYGNIANALHECGHAFACRATNVRVRSIGWVLHFFQLAAWVRPSREWRRRSNAERRIMVLTGPIVSFAVTGAALWVWLMTAPEQTIHEAALLCAVGSFIGGALTMVPFHSGDGSVLLADLVGSQELRQRSLALLKYLATGRERPNIESNAGWYAFNGVGIAVWRVALFAATFYVFSFLPVRLEAWHLWFALMAIVVAAAPALLQSAPGLVRGLGKWRPAWKRPSRPVLLAAMLAVVVLAPVPLHAVVPIVLDPAGAGHGDVGVGWVRHLRTEDAVDVRVSGETEDRSGTVRTIRFDPKTDRFFVDIDLGGAQPTTRIGRARLHLGWLPLGALALSPLEGTALRLWSWI